MENLQCSTVRSSPTVVNRRRKKAKRPSSLVHLKSPPPEDPFTSYVEQTFPETSQRIFQIIQGNPFLEGISPSVTERLTQSSLVESAFVSLNYYRASYFRL